MSRPGHIAFVLSTFLPLLAEPRNVPAPLQGVDVIEQLGDRVPEGGRLVDSEGRLSASRTSFTGGKPVVLALVYHRCPQLCNLTLSS